jgi:hypothetical protein
MKGNGNWGAYMQQGNLEELNKCGGELSIKIKCPVHYPAFNKPYFECKCNVVFPDYAIKGALSTGNWSDIINKHEIERNLNN